MEKINLVKNVAPLRNVMLLGALIRKVTDRDEGMPGMACFHGFSGYGKTQAAIYNTQATRACWIEVKSVWTRKTLVEKICANLRIPAGRNVAESVEKIGEELLKSGRPLLLDEAHILCTDGMMKLVHDIYESSHGASVILIGEEPLPQLLTRWERVHNRMLDWVPAQPADLREVGILAGLKCPDLTIATEVLEHALIVSQAVARRIVSNLNQVKDYARTEGRTEIGPGDIAEIRWMAGQAPAPRRIF
ncbi:AAA family ATPase [Pseudogemmobacter sonorensis]|uniref:AAA family ATPase n=1 Tax=Pseudogemmobacter sonorensis TaxID=2989681 RepID=UPI0036D04499